MSNETDNRAKSATLAEAWTSYASEVVPRDAPPVQRRETGRAFYAGAAAALGVAARIADADLNEADENAALRRLSDELRQHVADVKEGRA